MSGTLLIDNKDEAAEPGRRTGTWRKAAPLEAHFGRIGIGAVAAALVALRLDGRDRTAEGPAPEEAKREGLPMR